MSETGNAPPPPPPLPGRPLPPGVVPVPTPMKYRWLAWVLASVVLPAFPWLFANVDKDGTIVFVLLGFALVCQLAASIAVGIGLARNRGQGAGAMVGFSILFMVVSVAIGSAVFFVACTSFLMVQQH